ncbi:hypothetical protein C8Q69DRAFT_499259 [Paecilomyces variotii]|uniref:Uncharacterized protein n=1 Tax=Byssochlamys spectabilis TaxID=264951 RepID=A0A443HRQ9_BYSSP|nr:hypothetical protein C8Q69DRAFT_499259 [Paecilomyces variotii]RWQ94501.1 hypothetical protein C8Q69DRAFT_499259 [Paecilomyces variotii]
MSANPSGRIPDAWEDDFERQVDTSATENPSAEKKVSSKVSKAQRRAQHAEFNRQLWAEAPNRNSESSQSFHFLEARTSTVPLKQDFKPTVTLLSRKPQIASRQSSSVDSAAAGISRLGLNGEGDDDSDDESKKAPTMTPEERQAKALRDREEKQRRYEEVRERLFGSPSATTSGASSPGSTTPPRQHHSGEGRGKGKGRGGGSHSREKRDTSSASGRSRQLYDPGYTAKPNSTYLQKRDRQQSAERYDNEQQQSPQQPTRAPRGPDGSGRGGFGFSNRGAKAP